MGRKSEFELKIFHLVISKPSPAGVGVYGLNVVERTFEHAVIYYMLRVYFHVQDLLQVQVVLNNS